MKHRSIAGIMLAACCWSVSIRGLVGAQIEEEGAWLVREYSPVESRFTLGKTELWFRDVSDWCCVRPGWIVGVIHESPAMGSAVIPDLLAIQRHRGAIAINVLDGQMKWVTCDGLLVAIDSLLPMGDGRIGIVTRESDGWRTMPRCQIREWNLQSDVVGPARVWSPLLDSVARVLDLEIAAVELQFHTDSASPTLMLHERNTPSTTAVNVPFQFSEYEIPTEMSSLWEEGRETRWHAASDNAVSIVAFRGIRSGEWKLWEPYSPDSTLTLFDPRAEDGIRWQRSLVEIAGSDAGSVMRVVPLRTPWGERESIVIDWIEGGEDGEEETVHLSQIRLADGIVLREAEFPNRSEYFESTRWAALSPDQERVVFLDESNLVSPLQLQVFDFRTAGLLDPIPNSTGERWTELLTVLPTNEAVIPGSERLWSVGVGADNYGAIRELCRLFTEDVGGISPADQ